MSSVENHARAFVDDVRGSLETKNWMLDLGHPLLNRIAESFVKAAGIGAAQAVARESYFMAIDAGEGGSVSSATGSKKRTFPDLNGTNSSKSAEAMVSNLQNRVRVMGHTLPPPCLFQMAGGWDAFWPDLRPHGGARDARLEEQRGGRRHHGRRGRADVGPRVARAGRAVRHRRRRAVHGSQRALRRILSRRPAEASAWRGALWTIEG